VSTSAIDLNGTDNAGSVAQNDMIPPQANATGGFTRVATPPALSATPPATYPTWADTNLTSGTFSEYRIEAVDTWGNSAFVDTTSTTSRTTYDHKVTAVNANGKRTGALPAESAVSSESSA
jgi:hypothetical protein